MPAKPEERQYRSMAAPLAVVGEGVSKRFDTDFYIEGYASTFNDPYPLFSLDGWDYYEVISPDAFREADMTDVILQYDHAGQVYARQSNHTLLVEPDQHGLFMAADLSKTTLSRQMWEQVDAGLATRMSWAFTIAPDGESWTEDEADHRVTSTITKVSKVFDVSVVSYPADPNTEVSARSYLDGVIEREKRESQARMAAIARRRSLLALHARAAQVRSNNL